MKYHKSNIYNVQLSLPPLHNLFTRQFNFSFFYIATVLKVQNFFYVTTDQEET